MTPQDLVTANVRLAHHIAWRMWKASAQIRLAYGTAEDCGQQGMVGLCNAARLWDESRGIKFSTYAYYAIWREISSRAERMLLCRRTGDNVEQPHWEGDITRHSRRENGCPLEPSRESDVIENAELDEECRRLWDALQYLPERHAEAVRGRYGIGRQPGTLQEVGQRMGVSKERVRQLANEGVEALRRAMA